MKKCIVFLLISIFLLPSCTKEEQPVKNYMNESKEAQDARMKWWQDARFGMFIHWGLYSVPAGQWKDETGHAEWIRTTAQIPLETYNQFIDEFNPVKYNPAQWVSLAKEAGMQYMVITSKHHDGFCLFDSKYTDFDIMSTPYGKDLLKPLAEECNKQGIKMCWYHSIMDWHHPDYLPRRNWETDRSSENAEFDNYVKYMKSQLKELLTNYGDIGVLWFDGEWEKTWNDKRGRDLYNYVRSLQEDIIVNNRVGASRSGMAGFSDSKDSPGDFGTPEQEIPATGIPGVDWETCMTMNNHWGYNKYDDNWKSTEDLIHKLIDIASKGGNFLLNVGPKADGTFPQESIDRLKAIGQWMKKYSDAIYGSSASPFKHLEWGRCTQKKLKNGSTNLYFHIFDWPENNELVIPGLVSDVNSIQFLGQRTRNLIPYKADKSDLVVKLSPREKNQYASVLVVNIDGEPQIADAPEIIAVNNRFVKDLTVEIQTSIKDKPIHYTLDGSDPTLDSPEYISPIIITENSELNARVFIDEKIVSPLSTKKFQKVIPRQAIQIEKSNLKNGVICESYKGDWNELPDFSQLNPLTREIKKSIRLNNDLEKEYFGQRYSGYLMINEDAVYQFITESDDGSKLFIDDQLIVENDGLHSLKAASGSTALAKGLHKIEVHYFDKTGGNALKVFYQYRNNDKKELESERLFIKR